VVSSHSPRRGVVEQGRDQLVRHPSGAVTGLDAPVLAGFDGSGVGVEDDEVRGPGLDHREYLGQHRPEDDVLDDRGEPRARVGVGHRHGQPVAEHQMLVRRGGDRRVRLDAARGDEPPEDVTADVHGPRELFSQELGDRGIVGRHHPRHHQDSTTAGIAGVEHIDRAASMPS